MANELCISGFALKAMGLETDGEPTFEQWAEVGTFLRYAEGAVHWWVGDWLNYGEWRWGEKYAQALEATGFDYGTLRNDKAVAASIELSRRRDNLSWSHHQAVASLDEAGQDSALSAAESGGWTCSQLRQYVKELKSPHVPPPDFDLTAESSAIFSWLAQRRDAWPAHMRAGFVGMVRDHLSLLEDAHAQGGDRAEGAEPGPGCDDAGDVAVA